jgi:NAD(P)-dependent dehydrogenase (short-subunit alcohol dehydrogenase family)
MNNAHRVAIVTGASRGVGAGLVAGYRSLGLRVMLTEAAKATCPVSKALSATPIH